MLKKLFNLISSFVKDSKKEIAIGAVISVLIVSAVLALYILRPWLPLILLAIGWIWYYIYNENKRQTQLQKNKLAYIEHCLRSYAEHFKHALIAYSRELKFKHTGLGVNAFTIGRVGHKINEVFSYMQFEILLDNETLTQDALKRYARKLAKCAEMYISNAFEAKFGTYLTENGFVIVEIGKSKSQNLIVRFYIKNDFIFDLNSEIN